MLKTLEKLALDAKFQEETCELVFPETIDFEKVSEKYTEQMRNLLQDPSYEEEELFYRFYVGVVEQKDKLVFENEGLRYDIIIVAPGNVPEEFKKTSGHSHSVSLTGNLEYPEIYEVLEGEALFVLQKTDAKGNVVKAWAVHGKPGDKLLIPPGYGHATTNIGNGPLVFADLVADACANTYGVIANNHGMSLYIFKGENGYRIEKNPSYSEAYEIDETEIPEMIQRGLIREKPLYQAFLEEPEKFSYMKEPDEEMDWLDK